MPTAFLIYICSQLEFGYLCIADRHWNSLSFCLRKFLSRLQTTVWTEAAFVLLFKARSSSTWMSYVPHRMRKMLCLSDRNVRHHIHCWRHWHRTCCLPLYLGLMWSGSSLSVAGWQQDGETAWQGIWSCECSCKTNNGLLQLTYGIMNIYADVNVYICEFELILIMNAKTKTKLKLK